MGCDRMWKLNENTLSNQSNGLLRGVRCEPELICIRTRKKISMCGEWAKMKGTAFITNSLKPPPLIHS